MLWINVEGVCFLGGGLIVFFKGVGDARVFWFLREEFCSVGFPYFVCGSFLKTLFVFYSSSVAGVVSRLLFLSMHTVV